MIKNKYLYGRRVISDFPSHVKEKLGDMERHVIDTGADETYCGDKKTLFRERRYTVDVLDIAHEICHSCHLENKKRHWDLADITSGGAHD